MVTANTFQSRIAVTRNRVFARSMRHRPTECEKRFWRSVRNRQLGGYKFRRQVPIGDFIADFVCVERMLIVELDGSQHDRHKAYDDKRDTFLRSKGFRVLRIWDSDFLENPDGVMEVVMRELEAAPSPQPSPPKGGRGSDI